MGLGKDRGASFEENCLRFGIPPNVDRNAPIRRKGLDLEIADLTPVQKLSVACPICAAAPRERCCEITNGIFRQDAHFARLLSAAGQGTSLHQQKLSAEVLPNFLRPRVVPAT